MIELKPAINEVKLTLKSISSPINLGTVVEPVSGGSVPTDVRQAIYTLLENAAYATTGLEDEIAIVQAWAQEVTALSLEPTSLNLNNDIPQYITATVVPAGSAVSWFSSDEDVATVVDGIVTGVSNGSCVITATAGGKSASCMVTVSGFATLESISAVYTPNKARAVLASDSLDTLKHELVVTGTYSDSSTATIPSNQYYLSGTLTTGTSTITVVFHGKTTTFTVTVLAGLPTEYKRVEYLQNTMTTKDVGAYIDSGVKLTSPTTVKFKVGAKADAVTDAWTSPRFVMALRQKGTGIQNTLGYVLGLCAGNYSPQFAYTFSNSPYPQHNFASGEETQYHDLESTYTASSLTLKVDDGEAVSESVTTRAIDQYNIGIFGAISLNTQTPGATYMFKGSIYYAIAEENGTEIFHGIPCVRISDSKAGIYDIVNNAFKTASAGGTGGSASFIIAGADFE